MFEQVESALSRRDYRTARNLIKTLVHNQPNNELVHFYAAQLQEATEHFDNAKNIYKRLLVESVNPKIVGDARTGLQRVQTALQIQRQVALDQASQIPGGAEPGLLILEPVSPEARATMAPKFAAIMQTDNYTARLQFPSRGWRLYRLGNMGELSFYHQQLQQADIPNFCAPLSFLPQISVVGVKLIEEFRPQAVFNCMNDRGDELRINCAWPAVTQIVTGLLPVFEEIAEVNATTTHTDIRHKPKVLDYVQMCDLHIPSQNLILRFCNQSYSFYRGTDERISDLSTLTSRENWQRLLSQIHEKTSQAKLWSDFTPFAETALAYPEMLHKITSHVPLKRREHSLWDQAFQLYSSLIFWRSQLNNRLADLN
jgi:hypothetical protein